MLDLLIVGAGPCGLAVAISAQRAGLTARVLDAGSVVSTITQYPYYVSFFSTAEKLSLGGVPFVVATDKPSRRDGLAYYRAVVRYFRLNVQQYERVVRIARADDAWTVHSITSEGAEQQTRAKSVVIATGFFGSPNYLKVPGEALPHVRHVYREGHDAFDQDVLVVGGGNSAAEAALDLWRAGARVTLVHFGPTFDKRIKPWVLPDFENRAREGAIATRWNSRVASIEPGVAVVHTPTGEEDIAARFVYVMTGFAGRPIQSPVRRPPRSVASARVDAGLRPAAPTSDRWHRTAHGSPSRLAFPRAHPHRRPRTPGVPSPRPPRRTSRSPAPHRAPC